MTLNQALIIDSRQTFCVFSIAASSEVEKRLLVDFIGIGCNDYDAQFVRRSNGGFLIEHDRFPRLDGDHFPAGFVQRFDGALADGGHVEPHVLIWLGDFDQRHAAAFAQFARPHDTSVRTLDGFCDWSASPVSPVTPERNQ